MPDGLGDVAFTDAGRSKKKKEKKEKKEKKKKDTHKNSPKSLTRYYVNIVSLNYDSSA